VALSGLDIFKLLPKTNCGDCGVPTCMAFAMKLAQKKAELAECPHASEEARKVLGAAGEPPIRLVRIGDRTPLEIGGETVMFRHEKTFYHQPGIGIALRTSEEEDDLLRKIRGAEDYCVIRVGEELRTDLFLVIHDAADPERFGRVLELVRANSSKSLILDCADEDVLARGLDVIEGAHPALLLRGPVSERHIETAKTRSLSLILTSDSLEGLAAQASRARDAGLSDLILDVGIENLGDLVQANTIVRRSAVKANYKPFGYPMFTAVHGGTGFDTVARCTALLCKYDSILVLPDFDKAMLFTLFTLRQNIYTDPQKPIQVDPKIYAVGEPTPDSPVFVTTNFSLTYFMVSGEIENAGISAHLVVCDCEGQSVMTAWAAGKFTGETVAKFLKSVGMEEEVRTRTIIIPGYASVIQGDLEEKMPGWKVIVGPQEASDIPGFTKSVSLT
jgi:acetyl-CoA decarbonylase/synthase complex subunit gamma